MISRLTLSGLSWNISSEVNASMQTRNASWQPVYMLGTSRGVYRWSVGPSLSRADIRFSVIHSTTWNIRGSLVQTTLSIRNRRKLTMHKMTQFWHSIGINLTWYYVNGARLSYEFIDENYANIAMQFPSFHATTSN